MGDWLTHFCTRRVGVGVEVGHSRMRAHLVEFLSEPMRLEAVAEAALQHAVAGNFAQVSAAQPPHGACNCILLDERLAGSVGKG